MLTAAARLLASLSIAPWRHGGAARRGARPSSGPAGARPEFDALEARAHLDGAFTYTSYFPEGYTAENINEFVPLTNTNGVAVEFELHARYEWGERDQLLASGTIPPTARGGVTISDSQNPAAALARPNVPYALVLRATAPLAATFSHYDFGTAIGESFTTFTSTDWSFPDARKDSAGARSFVLVYNPADAATNLILTVFPESGGTFTFVQTVEAQRRTGWSVEDLPGVPAGPVSLRVTSSAPVVAAISHYELQSQRGFGTIGVVDGGATAGIIPSVEFDDFFYEINGSDFDSGRPRFAASASVSILNPGNSPANVSLVFLPDDDSPEPLTQTIVVPAQSRRTFDVSELAQAGYVVGDSLSALYQSDQPVAVTSSVNQGMDATGSISGTLAATWWEFGEGYMSSTRAGRAVQQTFYFFNPTSARTTVTMDFIFTNGTAGTIELELAAFDMLRFAVHDEPVIRDRAVDQWYGVLVTSTVPITAMMEHWDGGNGGGFATFGMPDDSVVPLSTALNI
ncbi:MAG: hypothetical protein SFZ23_14730 [Planctomycetota bacterium]|nr:hypothetical protein [Planctomycetota bacterium]